MPCGGIFPIVGSWVEGVAPADLDERTCWICAGGRSDLYCEEWDCYLHRRCLGRFLVTEEGALVLTHQHLIYVPEGDEEAEVTMGIEAGEGSIKEEGQDAAV